MKKLIILSILLTGCIGAGTLGGFEAVSFPNSKSNVVKAIDSIYIVFPNYHLPDKWKAYDNWSERGYDFLDSRIFYFKSDPEEMYYVTFIGDANDSVQKVEGITSLAIRAYMKADKPGKWQKESETSSTERSRIEVRFRIEIVSKINDFTKTSSWTEE